MIQKIPVLIVALPYNKDLSYLIYATAESTGVDLQSAIRETIYLKPRSRYLVSTNTYIEVFIGCEGQTQSRSGLSLNHGVVVLNALGIIDSDYQGEIKVVLINLEQETFMVERGIRITEFVWRLK